MVPGLPTVGEHTLFRPLSFSLSLSLSLSLSFSAALLSRIERTATGTRVGYRTISPDHVAHARRHHPLCPLWFGAIALNRQSCQCHPDTAMLPIWVPGTGSPAA